MGNNTSVAIRSNQDISNGMLQESKQECEANCTNTMTNTTVVTIGGSGNADIKQECSITGISCIMKASFDTQIENVLKSMLAQSSSSMSGFSLDFSNISQEVSLNQVIRNQVTQIMSSSCNFNSENTMQNLYFYTQDHTGNFSLSQSGAVSNSSCNMDNVAKISTYNTAIADVSQKTSIVNIFSMIFIVIIVCCVMGAIVIIVFLLTGGVEKVIASKRSGPQAPITTLPPGAVEALQNAVDVSSHSRGNYDGPSDNGSQQGNYGGPQSYQGDYGVGPPQQGNYDGSQSNQGQVAAIQ